VALLVVSLWTFSLLGKEFLPELDEGDLWVRVQFPVGVSLEGVRPYVHEIRERLLRFPQVRVVVSQLGAPDDGTDPEAPDNSEFYVGLKPREEWPANGRDKEKLIQDMTAALADIPGVSTNFSQPIKDNVDEALAGVKGELAIKLYGPDIFVMDGIARQISAAIKDIRGVADLDFDHLIGQPQLQIAIDRGAAARYGINVQDIQDTIEAATKGRAVTEIFEQERRFNLVVKVGQPGEPAARLRDVAVSAPNGERIPMSQLAEFSRTDGLAEIFRENNVRRLSIKWSVRERDMGSLVNEAMQKVEAAVKLPPGYRMVWSGRFEDQQRALSRLYVIVPLVVFIIFVPALRRLQLHGGRPAHHAQPALRPHRGHPRPVLLAEQLQHLGRRGLHRGLRRQRAQRHRARLVDPPGLRGGPAPPRGHRARLRDPLPAHHRLRPSWP
jgi:cobalt-zinc-cadmium resistance protein CzcA